MWDLPGPGIEPVSPALAGGFITTAQPGKPLLLYFLILHSSLKTNCLLLACGFFTVIFFSLCPSVIYIQQNSLMLSVQFDEYTSIYRCMQSVYKYIQSYKPTRFSYRTSPSPSAFPSRPLCGQSPLPTLWPPTITSLLCHYSSTFSKISYT